MTYQSSRRLTSAAGAAAPPTSSGTSCEAALPLRLQRFLERRQSRRDCGTRRARGPANSLRSDNGSESPAPGSAPRRRLKGGASAPAAAVAIWSGCGAEMTKHPCCCTAPLRAAAPKERRLTNVRGSSGATRESRDQSSRDHRRLSRRCPATRPRHVARHDERTCEPQARVHEQCAS